MRANSKTSWSIFYFAGTCMILGLILLRTLGYEIRRDEQLFIPPAQLLGSMSLYSEFFYNHVPVSAWWFHLVHSVSPFEGLVLNARLAVFCFWLLLAAAIPFICSVLARSMSVTAFVTALFLTAPALLNQTGMTATNNFMPIVLVFLGIGLFLAITKGQLFHPVPAFLSGLFLALAAAVKISAIAFVPALAVAAFFVPRGIAKAERTLKLTLPFAAGGIVGALPVLGYLASDPARFLAHVYGFHSGPHIAYWANRVATTDEAVAIGMRGKLSLAQDIWLTGSSLICAFILVLLGVLWAQNRTSSANQQNSIAAIAVLLVSCLAGITVAFVPSPGFPQYFTMVFAALPLLVPLLFGSLAEDERRVAKPALAAGTIVILALGLPRLLQHGADLARFNESAVFRSHEFGRQIAERVKLEGIDGKVATLASIYPLEGGLAVYPELATGPFVYRTGSLLTEDLKGMYVATYPGGVAALLLADPPAAIVAGFDEELERPLIAYAAEHDYRLVPEIVYNDRYGSAKIYLRPK